MINFKKIDDLDLVFVNKPLTAKEEKEFSDFLKARKSKSVTRKTIGTRVKSKKELA
jgi:hypothetical protein